VKTLKLVLVVALMLLVMPQAMALKYTIDGDLSDWGVDLSGNWSLNETWVPNDGVKFLVEDNRDPRYPVSPANPDYPYTGVHIKGTGSLYERYFEDPVYSSHYNSYVYEPIGGEEWDLEAIYLDEDTDYIYVAVVTSLAPNAKGDLAPGDLALNLDGDDTTGKYGYEYGVKLGTKTGLTQWEIGYLPNWTEPRYIPENRPSVFKGYLPGGHANGTAIGAYVQIPKSDYGEPNYVIEIAIPKDKIGMAGKSLQYDEPFPKIVHITDACGNDRVEFPIPEFLSILIPVSIMFGIIYYLRKH